MSQKGKFRGLDCGAFVGITVVGSIEENAQRKEGADGRIRITNNNEYVHLIDKEDCE